MAALEWMTWAGLLGESRDRPAIGAVRAAL
jgi:hypothetical protein